MLWYSASSHQPIPYQMNDVYIRQQSLKMEDENFTAKFSYLWGERNKDKKYYCYWDNSIKSSLLGASHMLTCFSFKTNCWFSHDVTKIQTTKLSILPRFYFHDASEQLKTNFHTNFRFKRVLGFVIEYAWISKLLRDAAFTWRPRELSCRLKKWLISGNFAI